MMKAEFLACCAAGLLVHVAATAQTAPTDSGGMGNMGTTTAPADGTMPPPADPNAQVPPAPVPPVAGMAPAAPGTTPDPSAPVGTSANPVVVGGNAVPPPPTPQTYPVCSKTVQDSCINPADARKQKKRR